MPVSLTKARERGAAIKEKYVKLNDEVLPKVAVDMQPVLINKVVITLAINC
jgi:hypothetical protein